MDNEGILESEVAKLSKKISVQLEFRVDEQRKPSLKMDHSMPMMVYFFTKKQWETISKMLELVCKASISQRES